MSSSFLRQVCVIGLVWWVAWRLSLSKVPLLRECIGGDARRNSKVRLSEVLGSDRGSVRRNVPRRRRKMAKASTEDHLKVFSQSWPDSKWCALAAACCFPRD
eukprot:symbB.v1.2.011454.t1/scaffold713.1/size170176/3